MRILLASAAMAAGALLASGACAATDDVTAPIVQFIAAFDKGDIKAAAATHENDNLTITDEVAPYSWKGPHAFEGWVHDLMADDAKAGLSGESVAISAPSRIETSGDSAYVVVPAVYSFKDHGAPMSESAQMTFALHRGAAGWKITAWTWTGPRASPAH